MARKRQLLRGVYALFHGRFQRRQNFIINSIILEEREAMVKEERRIRAEDPMLFSRTGFYDGPFGNR